MSKTVENRIYYGVKLLLTLVIFALLIVYAGVILPVTVIFLGVLYLICFALAWTVAGVVKVGRLFKKLVVV